MRKLSMIIMCMAVMLAAGTSLKAQEVTITLSPGWTWISNPSTDTLDFQTVFGSFTPVVGDIVKSQWGSAIYRGDGQWRGSISQFYPGFGYMYKSTRTIPVSLTFNAQQPAPQVVVTTSEPTDITTNSATCGGNVASSNGDYVSVTLRGICWSTNPNPTFNDNYIEAGNGLGSFTVSMTELTLGTTYYVRTFAVTVNGTFYGEQKIFSTRDGIPSLTTTDVTNITGVSAFCGGNIIDDGGLDITARGVCWSMFPNPTIADLHTVDSSGMGSFCSYITELNPSACYYVKAYAITSAGVGYGEEKSFTTRDGIPSLTTMDVANIGSCWANSGGNITDDGGLFIIERGVCWSTLPNPTIADAHTTDGSGTGVFNSSITGLFENTTYYVRAYATNNFTIAYGNEEIFITLSAPIGVINALFSVSDSTQVFFSQGNLQYQASTNTWRFAENQWDHVGSQIPDGGGNYGGTVSGSDNSNISNTYSGWIDLFGWGTSSYNHGAVCYQPWSISTSDNNYYVYGNSSYNLYDQTGQADWGYNPISNGGNQPNQWHTLTKEEWVYVFNTRNTASGIRFAKARVNNVGGVILLPDDWNSDTYSLNGTNNRSASYNSNILTISQWSVLEQAGAVFLPTTGHRYNGTSTAVVNTYGRYWSASLSSHDLYDIHILDFYGSGLDPQSYCYRYFGLSVRLVRNVE